MSDVNRSSRLEIGLRNLLLALYRAVDAEGEGARGKLELLKDAIVMILEAQASGNDATNEPARDMSPATQAAFHDVRNHIKDNLDWFNLHSIEATRVIETLFLL